MKTIFATLIFLLTIGLLNGCAKKRGPCNDIKKPCEKPSIPECLYGCEDQGIVY